MKDTINAADTVATAVGHGVLSFSLVALALVALIVGVIVWRRNRVVLVPPGERQ